MATPVRRLLMALGAALAFSGLPLAASATSFSVSPWAYACGQTVFGNPVSQQVGPGNANCTETDNATPGGAAAALSSGTLTLSKSGATATNAASGASIFGVTTLDSVSFDLGPGSYCGAGAPRLNVVTSDGDTHFFGCAANNTGGHVSLNLGAAGDGNAKGGVLGKTIASIDFVQDEVTIGEGPQTATAVLTNIQFIGAPTPAPPPPPAPTPTPAATATPTVSPTHAPTAAPTAVPVSRLATTGRGTGVPWPGLGLALGLGLLLVLAGGVVVARTQVRRF
jgi:cell division septation protein DedD